SLDLALKPGGLDRSRRCLLVRRGADPNWRRLVGWRSGPCVELVQRNQDICLRIIGRDRTLGDVVGDRSKVAHDAYALLRSRIRYNAHIDEIAVLQAAIDEI